MRRQVPRKVTFARARRATKRPITRRRVRRRRPTENRHKFLDGDAQAGTRVLLVDDDCRDVFAIKAMLERTKAAVKIAGSGEDALYTMQRTPKIDIVKWTS